MNNLKIIAIGDQHFQINNITDVNLFIEKILILLNHIKPDIIVCLGDLLHTHERLHTIALNKALEFINYLRNITKTFVLVGNHDYVNNSQFLTDNHWLNPIKEWKNVIIVDKPLDYNINGFNLCFMPYVFPGRFKEALNTINKDYNSFDIIFAHQEFKGCKMGAIVSIEGDSWEIDDPHIISGHIHSKQRIQDNIYYTGACMQHAFGESDTNTIPLICLGDKYDLDNELESFEFSEPIYTNIYEMYEIDLNLPRKKIIYMDTEDVSNFKINENKDINQIKLTISGNYEEFKALKKTKKFKELNDKGIKVIFKPKKIDILNKITNINELKENKSESSDFKEILLNIVNNDKNVYLLKAFENVINDKHIDISNVMFL